MCIETREVGLRAVVVCALGMSLFTSYNRSMYY